MAERSLNSTETLRVIMAVSAAISIPLSITTGAVCHNVLPAIGVIPNLSSGIFSLIALRQSLARKSEEEHADMGIPHSANLHRSSLKRKVVNVALDISHILALLAVLIPTWILFPQHGYRRYYYGTPVELEAYGTMPMLLNFVLHTWIVLSTVLGGFWKAILAYLTPYPSNCPHCYKNIRPRRNVGLRGRGNRGEYGILLPTEEEEIYDDDPQSANVSARPSMEEGVSSPKAAEAQ